MFIVYVCSPDLSDAVGSASTKFVSKSGIGLVSSCWIVAIKQMTEFSMVTHHTEGR